MGAMLENPEKKPPPLLDRVAPVAALPLLLMVGLRRCVAELRRPGCV